MTIDGRVAKIARQITDRIPKGVRPVGFEPVTKDRLQEIVERIVKGVDPERIILFGSYAYGNPNEDSDLDILVIMESTARPAERSLMVSRLLRPRPFPMDILVRSRQEIEQAKKEGNVFFLDIIQRGKVIYDRDR